MTMIWLDYDKPPPGYEVDQDLSSLKPGAPLGKWAWLTGLGVEQGRESTWSYEDESHAVTGAWLDHKSQNDPPGLMVMGTGDASQRGDILRRFFFLSSTDAGENETRRAAARAEAWAWHDRRRKIAIDIAEQHLEIHRAADLLAKFIRWTDAECEAVERYAALPWRERMAATMPPAFKLAMYPDSEPAC